MLPDKQLEIAVELFHSLAEPTRLKILDILREKVEACPCQIAPIIRKDQSVVFRHLQIMKEAGLVDMQKKGVATYYSIRNKKIMDIVDYLIREINKDNSSS
jgi:DNA-binding transcriptional ArsR family regulator